MVAVTVVLAASVFVIVASTKDATPSATPAISFDLHEATDRLNVDSAVAGADWNRLAVRLKAAAAQTVNMGQGASPYQNEDPVTSGRDLSVGLDAEVTGNDDPVNANDYLAFCASTATVSDVVVLVVDTSSNTNVGEYTFLRLASCSS